MRKCLFIAIIGIVCCALSPLFAAEEAKPSVTIGSPISLELGGYIKVDASYDDSETNNGNYGMYVKEERSDASTIDQNKNDDEFNLTANQTRIWLNLNGPTVKRIKTGGKIEMDFWGNGAGENKPDLRLRHAYLTCDFEDYGFSLLAGQTWDVFSPLVPSTLNFTVGWYQGNVGFRRPQIRLTKECETNDIKIKGAIAVCRTIGGETISRTNTDYGEQSGMPVFEGRLGVGIPFISNTKRLVIGVSGHYGKEQVETAALEKDIDTYSVNVDLTMPLGDDLIITGEWFSGGNLDNYFGGIGQGINATDMQKIRSEGGWAQMAYTGCKDWKFVVGGGIDNPHDGDLADSARERNQVIFTNMTYNLTPNAQLGVEYSHLRTDYKNARMGQDNRIQFSAIYKF